MDITEAKAAFPPLLVAIEAALRGHAAPWCLGLYLGMQTKRGRLLYLRDAISNERTEIAELSAEQELPVVMEALRTLAKVRKRLARKPAARELVRTVSGQFPHRRLSCTNNV